MARYIDADALMEMLKKKAQTDLEMGLYNHGTLTQSFIRFVERQPTADVAPRAEVAREILADIRDKGGFNDPFVEYICLSYDELIVLERKYTATTAEPPKGE